MSRGLVSPIEAPFFDGERTVRPGTGAQLPASQANIPEDDGGVPSAGGQHLAIGAEGKAVHGAVVADQRPSQWLTRGHIPESDGPLKINVYAGGGEQFTIRAKGHTAYVFPGADN